GGARCDVIPNGLDLEHFRPRDAASCRERLGLPRDRLIVLTGGVNVLTDPNKGLDLMRDALRRLPDLGVPNDVEWVVFGTPEASFEQGMVARRYASLYAELLEERTGRSR